MVPGYSKNSIELKKKHCPSLTMHRVVWLDVGSIHLGPILVGNLNLASIPINANPRYPRFINPDNSKWGKIAKIMINS
jgi:hypothetical protein